MLGGPRGLAADTFYLRPTSTSYRNARSNMQQRRAPNNGNNRSNGPDQEQHLRPATTAPKNHGINMHQRAARTRPAARRATCSNANFQKIIDCPRRHFWQRNNETGMSKIIRIRLVQQEHDDLASSLTPNRPSILLAAAHRAERGRDACRKPREARPGR